jgi:hypothetical protein
MSGPPRVPKRRQVAVFFTPEHLREVDAAATRMGMSRTAYVVACALERSRSADPTDPFQDSLVVELRTKPRRDGRSAPESREQARTTRAATYARYASLP